MHLLSVVGPAKASQLISPPWDSHPPLWSDRHFPWRSTVLLVNCILPTLSPFPFS